MNGSGCKFLCLCCLHPSKPQTASDGDSNMHQKFIYFKQADMFVKLDLIQSLARDPAAVLGAFRCSRSYRLCHKHRNIDSLLASSVHFFQQTASGGDSNMHQEVFCTWSKSRVDIPVFMTQTVAPTAPEHTEHGNLGLTRDSVRLWIRSSFTNMSTCLK